MASYNRSGSVPIESAEEPFETLCPEPDDVVVVESVSQATRNYYRTEFENLFGNVNVGLLRSGALKGNLRSCRFRSLCWRIFLECLPEDRSGWLDKVEEFRAKYDEISDEFMADPRALSSELDVNNPLSQEEASPWNQYFQDNELRLVIKQDVVRTFPEISFFSEPSVQKALSNILFYYAKENPSVSYKQGMHEILAPLFFVVYSDQQTCIHATDIGLLSAGDQVDREIKILLDPKYLEHDTYFLFQQVMEAIEPWYSQNSLAFKTDGVHFEPFVNNFEPASCSVLGIKLKMIFEQILKKRDFELFSYLLNLQITPQIFGIRWMRLLFGREFSMQDLLVMWDAIFADSISFSLCDYIFVAMLTVIRKLLLVADYSQCMGYLMRYPNISDVHYVIDMALHLKDPLSFNEPSSHSLIVLPNAVNPTGNPTFRREHLIITPSAPVSQATMVMSKSVMPRSRTFDGTANGIDHDSRASDLSGATARSKSLNAGNGPDAGARKTVEREMKSMSVLSSAADLKLDYCWKHLTSQIETLQKCLSQEESLKKEDEIFVALAELKKVRDILKGSLRIMNEIQSPTLKTSTTSK